MSLANIHSAVCSKASLHALLPIAFLPIAKFIHCDKRMKGVLLDRLYHQSLDIVVEPLKLTAQIRVMLSDPLGNSHYCFTPLAGCIVDTPEVCLIACVWGKISLVMLANYAQFGDDFRYPDRTKAITLTHIWSIAIDPDNLSANRASSMLAPTVEIRAMFWNIGKYPNLRWYRMSHLASLLLDLWSIGLPTQQSVPTSTSSKFLQQPQITMTTSQIWHFIEKFHALSLALHLRKQQLGLSSNPSSSAVLMPDNDDQTEDYAGDPSDFSELLQGEYNHSHPTTDYFKIASHLDNHRVSPLQTFITGSVAFHLNYDPAVKSINIDNIAEHYSLPDLCAALVHYTYHEHNGHPLQIGGRRRFCANECLPFKKLQIWHKICLRQHGYHDYTTPLPPQTLNAHPLKPDWPKGRYDATFVNINDETQWPWSGLKGLSSSFYVPHVSKSILLAGHTVCKIHLIFRPILLWGQHTTWWSNTFLVYATWFDLQTKDPVTGMFSLKHATLFGGVAMGDVFPLAQLWALALIVPKFGAMADVRLTSKTSSLYSTFFYLNHFFDK